MTVYDVAFRRTSKGKTTGPISRLLSAFQLLLYAFIVATMLRDQLYLPLVVLILLAITPIAPLATILGVIYFAVARYWPVVTLLVLSWIVAWMSVRAGIKYNERRIGGKAALVDPFENMPDAQWSFLLVLLTFPLALLTFGAVSIMLWVIAAGALAFAAYRYAFRLQSPWATLHYPLILRFSALAGEEAARSGLTTTPFDTDRVLARLVQSAYPSWPPGEVAALVAIAKGKKHAFTDRGAIEMSLQARNPSLQGPRLDHSMNAMRDGLQKDESPATLRSE